ncbi:MAG: threonine/serine exporter family protein [Thermomicrobiales bacterium]
MTSSVAEPILPAPLIPVSQAMDAAARVGAILMQSGASTESSVVAVREMLSGLDLAGVNVTIGGDAVIVSATEHGVPLTIMRTIPTLGANLERASMAHVLAERVHRGAISGEGIAPELAAVSATPAPYNRYVVAVALGIAGLAFNQLMGGTLTSAAVVFVANVVAHLARTELTQRKSPVAVTALATAVIATVIAAIGVRMGLAPMAASTFIPAITLLIPGFALINGLLDLSSLRYVMVGLQRVLIAVLTFLVIGIGIAAGIALVGG